MCLGSDSKDIFRCAHPIRQGFPILVSDSYHWTLERAHRVFHRIFTLCRHLEPLNFDTRSHRSYIRRYASSEPPRRNTAGVRNRRSRSPDPPSFFTGWSSRRLQSPPQRPLCPGSLPHRPANRSRPQRPSRRASSTHRSPSARPIPPSTSRSGSPILRRLPRSRPFFRKIMPNHPMND
jgi:hypothetical protein